MLPMLWVKGQFHFTKIRNGVHPGVSFKVGLEKFNF